MADEAKPGHALTTWEQRAKIFSLTAIPLVLGVGGWFIQQRLSEQDIQRDYVSLAVSVINDPSSVRPELLDWAVDLLAENSPTPLPNEVIEKLKTGVYELPQAERSQTDLVASLGSDTAVAVPSSDWFTVLGTFNIDDLEGAWQRADALAAKIDSALGRGQIQTRVYRTKISNDYAVTLGDRWSRSQAISYARRVRESGLVTDAFAQVDKAWEPVDRPSQPPD